MMLMVTYDLKKPGKDYGALHEAIKSLGVWWHYLESTWLVDTAFSTKQAWDKIASCIDRNDFLLIIEVKSNYQGWLPKDAWDWMSNRKF